MYRYIYKTSVFLGVALASLMTVVVIYQIVSRYLPIWSAPWSEELARFLWLWVVGLIAGPAYVHGGFVGIDLIPNMLNPVYRRRLRRVMHFIAAIFSVVLIFKGWELAERTTNQISPALGVNMSIINASISVVGLSLFMGTVYCLFWLPDAPEDLNTNPFDTTGSK